MLKAHRAMESLTLDREVAHLKDDLMPRYAALVYNGYWWSPERKMLQTLIDASQAPVNGTVRVKLYKGNVIIAGRKSDDSLSLIHILAPETRNERDGLALLSRFDKKGCFIKQIYYALNEEAEPTCGK